jgi:ferrochelatase
LVAEGVDRSRWQLAFQSRSGPPQQPWLGPDVGDLVEERHAGGQPREVVVVPIGFLSDHMEVVYDLDTLLRERCDRLDVHMVRAATVGTHPRFVRMIRELIVERAAETPQRLALGRLGPNHDVCPDDCCLLAAQPRPLP